MYTVLHLLLKWKLYACGWVGGGGILIFKISCFNISKAQICSFFVFTEGHLFNWQVGGPLNNCQNGGLHFPYLEYFGVTSQNICPNYICMCIKCIFACLWSMYRSKMSNNISLIVLIDCSNGIVLSHFLYCLTVILRLRGIYLP